MDSVEPILTPSLDRFCLYPIKYLQAYHMYKQHVACFWSVDEVDLAHDITDFELLSKDEKDFILHVLSFFAASDGIVNENLAERFSEEVQVQELRMFYGFQIGMETIHTDMYGLLIETYEKDAGRRHQLHHAIKEGGSVTKKGQWALKWLKVNAPFAERLIAFAAVEGIFFSASFCAIFYFKKRGKLPGLTFSNELISRDEGLHRDFACHVYSLLENKLSDETVQAIIKDAVDAEIFYVKEALRVDIIGMNMDLMIQYVKFVADHLLLTLSHPKLYNVENPFEWMELISLPGKTNFFEKRVAEYQKANTMNYNTENSKKFSLEAEF